MATQAYYTWDKAGRRYTVAKPVQQLVDMAKAQAIPILGIIGNNNHLWADFPEDHTPFSFTAWPLPLPGYVVTACDIAYGPWAERLLQMAKDGRAPYVKYLNFNGKNYSVKRGWTPVDNSDRHLHISVRTDQLSYNVIHNPFINGGNNVATADEIIQAWSQGMPKTPDGKIVAPVDWRIRDEAFQSRVLNELSALKTGGIKLSDEQIAVLSQRLADETSAEVIENALRTVLKKGVDNG